MYDKSATELKEAIDAQRDRQETSLKDRLSKRRQQKEEELKKKDVDAVELERARKELAEQEAR
eukprot:55191-Eustigmatos_ZCMA.PRE.1